MPIGDEDRRLRSIQMTFYKAHRRKRSLTATAQVLSREANQESGALETVDVAVEDTQTGDATVHASLIYV
jgi:hypothetical protein